MKAKAAALVSAFFFAGASADPPREPKPAAEIFADMKKALLQFFARRSRRSQGIH